MTLAGRIMAALFLVCAVVQINDPDPIPWIAIYLAAGAVAGLTAANPRRLPRWVPALVALTAIVWAVTLSPALGRIRPNQIAATMHADTPAIEESRESLGLFIVAAWMAVVLIRAARATGSRPPGA